MERTWRWFGKNDKITLAMLRQIGVQGIVTALHDVPNGEVWTREKIHDLKAYIESYGMRWSVVESLPVSESIKYAGKDRDELIEKYKVSLRNLSAEGIHTICYNFMPVLDWARTDLSHPNPNGTTNLYFSHAQFAYFDICILQRANAKNDYSQKVLDEVEKLKQTMTPEDNYNLVENIIVKTQGFVSGNISEGDEHPVELFRELLDLYKGITKEQLRENMRYFLEAIMPTCHECDIKMAIHQDDPPWDIFGLPRLLVNAESIDRFLSMVDDPYNCLTLCSGSMNANPNNNVAEIVRKHCDRIPFAHIRNIHHFENGDFSEAAHRDCCGETGIIEILRAYHDCGFDGCIRPDHGRQLWEEGPGNCRPGYGKYDRALGIQYMLGVWDLLDRLDEEKKG